MAHVSGLVLPSMLVSARDLFLSFCFVEQLMRKAFLWLMIPKLPFQGATRALGEKKTKRADLQEIENNRIEEREKVRRRKK